MKYFLDTEFIEKPCTIQLISIAMVAEDGREFYAISNGFRSWDADEWVRENIIRKLEPEIPRKANSIIAQEILDLVGEDRHPEFWAYHADYDWVAFCWLFGKMIDLPKHFPMYCRDLKQLIDFHEIDKQGLPVQEAGYHNALEDARWVRDTIHFIQHSPTIQNVWFPAERK